MNLGRKLKQAFKGNKILERVGRGEWKGWSLQMAEIVKPMGELLPSETRVCWGQVYGTAAEVQSAGTKPNVF